MYGTLYLQSSYSMLKNTIPLPVLIENAKKGNYDFIALSDEQLHGMLHLFKHAEKHHIKPILGLKVSVNYTLGQTGFLVFVKNNVGYQNILKISLLKSKNELTYEALVKYQEGLIFVTSGQDTIINQLILNKQSDQALSIMIEFKQKFESFYLGLSLDTFDMEVIVAPKLKELAKQVNLKYLPIHETSYLIEDDKVAYEALRKIDDDSHQMPEDAHYQFMDKDTLIKHFSDYKEVFTNLDEMVNLVNFKWVAPVFDMPKYEIKGTSSKAYLKSLAIKGLKKRLEGTQKTHHIYQERLLYELSVIHDMGFDHYFLIVFDFVRYAKTHDILVGPGRGSAAGSLVSYCLGITDVDPIEYDLLFERFLNPERITMPDIDLDFPDNKRDEVISYVKEKYGKDHMISIITFGTFAVRSSIRDIARVMKIDIQRVNAIIKRVLNDQVDTKDQETVRLLEVAKKIEGLPRHTGTHAAGMILAEQDLSQYIPLLENQDGFYQSQFEASDLESLGLLKIDFLGIRNLQIIHDVIELIKLENPKFQLNQIPLDDTKTYDLLSQARSEGVFQLESNGMKNVLRKLKPNTFEDIIALLALFRPGPMDHIDEYIERRNGKPYEIIHPQLTDILKPTYGIIIYQEQIMRIANEFAGYTLAQADLLRRGISKKNLEILEKERLRFIEKCAAKNYSKDIAETIYDLIVKFANYGFNRSHSVAYSLVAYQMAYLKANHFQKFMTVLLSNSMGNVKTTYEYITDLRRHHIDVLPPDINKSTDTFILKDNQIILPLLSIKSIGKAQVQKIIDARADTPFKDFHDFKMRLKNVINDKNIEMLIHSGALDSFKLNHHTMIENKDASHAGYELYITDFKLQEHEEYGFRDLALNEKEAIGFNLVYHPLQMYQAYIKEHKLQTIEDLNTQKQIRFLGFITHKKIIKTKQGKPMVFITIDDGQHQIEATLFTQTYLDYESLLDEQIKMFDIKENVFKEKKTYVVDKIFTIEKVSG
ncbi:DNA polymerase III subunit alpha [Mariniplasma anaerobium]|uniref:DNA-directed DNA polymerase n=1 Tax=Mariniplasma anaerobium TaxID=2735436 RepID=A0A7U9XVT0_9MOLU|nr:DNA polymerase III subunit alpha [Mariniplasma anaerobium]BCR35497.1 DNA-directed DNA polymerase [Mariniplasma anaerobium]